jgi:hypothetical protein
MTDAAPVYFEKVETLVKKLMRHRWNEEELVAYFLIHCVKEKEIKREIRMREASTVAEIKAIIAKVDAINIEVSGIAATQRKETFAKVVQKRNDFENLQKYRGDQREQRDQYREPKIERRFVNDSRDQRYVNQPRREEETRFARNIITCWSCGQNGHTNRECQQRRNLTCYSCGKEGHISRNCSQKQQSCYACKEQGHLRHNCPNISCSGCSKKGHFKFQCHNNTYQERRFKNFQNNDRRHNVAAMTSYHDEVGENMRCADDEMRANNQFRDDDGDDVIDRTYPKGRASTLDEMIGAME